MAKTIKIKRHIEELKNIYRQIDTEIKKFNGRIICQKGCSSCCEKAENYGYPVEAVNVISFLNSNLTNEEKKMLSYRIKDFDRKYNLLMKNRGTTFKKDSLFIENLLKDFSKVDIKCPFLTEKNECIIYPSRPFICRIYISHSQSECEGLTFPDIMQSEDFLKFFDKIKKHLNSVNKDFFIAIGYDSLNVIPFCISRYIEYDDLLNEFIFVGSGGKKFKLIL